MAERHLAKSIIVLTLAALLGFAPIGGAASSDTLLRIVFVGWDQSIFGAAYPILNKYNATAYFHPSEQVKRKVGLPGCLTALQFDHLLQSGWQVLTEEDLASETAQYEELIDLDVTLNDFQSGRLLVISLYYLAERGGQLTLFLNGVTEQEFHASLCPSRIFELVLKTATNLGIQIGEGVDGAPASPPE